MSHLVSRDPRERKLRDWRRNRWDGHRWDSSDHRNRERNSHGRPWEGRGWMEAVRRATDAATRAGASVVPSQVTDRGTGADAPTSDRATVEEVQ